MTEVGPAFSNAEIGETRKEKKKDKKERKEKKEGDKSKKVKKEKRRLEDESLQACTSCFPTVQGSSEFLPPNPGLVGISGGLSGL